MGDNFHHHPDNIIFVRTSSGIYQDTLANFLLDMATIVENYTALPAGYDERYYDPSKKHFLANRCTSFPQAIPWAEGDTIIANYDDLVAAKVAREAE